MSKIVYMFTSLFLFVCFFAASAMAEDYKITFVDAKPENGFNFPYYLRVPHSGEGAGPQVLIVESNNSGLHDDIQTHIDKVASHITGNGIGPGVAGKLKQPLLIPVFPRSETDWQVYTHALDRDTIVLKNTEAARLDLQLLRMVEDAQSRLKRNGTEVAEKFVIVGFSASGTFSNRFAFLHPERLLAVVSGAVNAFPMLPVPELKNTQLAFPLGTSDIKSLTGQAFNVKEWKKLPQFIFMGAIDDNDALQFDDAYSDSERKIVFKVLAEAMGPRWSLAQTVYLEQKPNVTFITYGQVGHWTDRRINRDISTFVKTEIERAYMQK